MESVAEDELVEFSAPRESVEHQIFDTSGLGTNGAPSLALLLSIMTINEGHNSSRASFYTNELDANQHRVEAAGSEIGLLMGSQSNALVAAAFPSLAECIPSHRYPFAATNPSANQYGAKFSLSALDWREQGDYWSNEIWKCKYRLFELRSSGASIPRILPTLRKLAICWKESGVDWQGADDAYWHLYRISRQHYGKDHRESVLAIYEEAINDLGDWNVRWGGLRRAMRKFTSILQPFAKTLNEDDSLFLNIMELGSRILRLEGAYQRAEHGQRQLIRIALTNNNITSTFLLQLLSNLGKTLHEKESYTESEEVKTTVLCLQQTGRFNVTLPDEINAQVALAKTYRAQGNPEKGIRILQHSLARWTALLSPSNDELVPARTELVISLRLCGWFEEASKVEKPMSDNQMKWGCSRQYPRSLDTEFMKGNACHGESDYKSALWWYHQVVEEFRCADRVRISYDIADVYNMVGWSYQKMQGFEEASKWFWKEFETRKFRQLLCENRLHMSMA
jgi:tetratricopeptide (TPR) repeat protein